MSIFSVQIECDNDAFAGDPGEELARILYVVGQRQLFDLNPAQPTSRDIKDVNGNKVGRWSYEP